MSEPLNNNMQIYQFPVSDETIAETNKTMNSHLPFAIVGSNDFVKVGGNLFFNIGFPIQALAWFQVLTCGCAPLQVGNKMVRARQYPWGVVQVENENHCDFTNLREMLIRTNMEDLRDTTHSRHFKVYRYLFKLIYLCIIL